MALNTVTIFIILVPIVVLVLLLLSVLFAPVKPDAEKTSAYECGFSAITGQTRSPFSIAYYVVAMLFRVFDLEVRLRFPLAQTLYAVQTFGFWIAMLFFIILTLGFVFELGSGALQFTDQRAGKLSLLYLCILNYRYRLRKLSINRTNALSCLLRRCQFDPGSFQYII